MDINDCELYKYFCRKFLHIAIMPFLPNQEISIYTCKRAKHMGFEICKECKYDISILR